jgi:hypothetical protein
VKIAGYPAMATLCVSRFDSSIGLWFIIIIIITVEAAYYDHFGTRAF